MAEHGVLESNCLVKENNPDIDSVLEGDVPRNNSFVDDYDGTLLADFISAYKLGSITHVVKQRQSRKRNVI